MLGPLLEGLVPAVSIPVWDQYVDLVEWSLNGLAGVFNSGGLAIIAFTILIKTVLLPLTVRSIQSSKAMQELQPKIKELQKKHGKDRQRLSQETMALYGQHRVNPMAGCLPMLVQIPIFFGLYRGIINLSNSDAGPWHGTFLWLNDGLAKADPIFLLPILAGIFQFVQTRMMRPANQGKITDPQQNMMNMMMNIMPLTVIAFGWGFASGAVLYWATQSIYSVVQQWFITGWGSLGDWFPKLPELPEHRRLGYRPPRPVEDVVVVSGEGGQPVRAGAMGWLQKRMEDAQRQAEARGAGGRAGGGQDRADAESDEIAAASTGPVRVAGATNGRANGKTSGQANGRANGPGGPRRKGGGKTGGARTKGTAANGRTAGTDQPAAGGQTGRAGTASGAVIVPRKARPAPGTDGGTAGA